MQPPEVAVSGNPGWAVSEINSLATKKPYYGKRQKEAEQAFMWQQHMEILVVAFAILLGQNAGVRVSHDTAPLEQLS